jgi:RNA polymerase sigma-70 factor, ECF subfamily
MLAKGEITDLLLQVKQGDRHAESRLMAVLYDDLRRIARRLLSRERSDHTLSPTALVNEAYMRLVGQQGWNDRTHFFSVAAQVMRRILVDYARSRYAAKRGGHLFRVDLHETDVIVTNRSEDILALDNVLSRLSAQDQRQARIVELRFFAGLAEEEIAELLEISTRTVKREWSFAKAWLKRELATNNSGANSQYDRRTMGSD